MDLVAAIEKRHSIRRYDGRRVPEATVRQVVTVGRNALPLRPEIGIRWYIVWEGSVLARRLTGRAGVYGMFTSAPHYLIAVSQERRGFMENLGFCMEQLILAAAVLGLGTCWVGSMFTEEGLRDLVPDLEADERIVALTPLGYGDESPTTQIARRLLRWDSEYQGARKPLHELVSQDIWATPWTPRPGEEDAVLARIFELTRLAPSWANTQPWHFVVNDRQVIATVNHVPQKGNVREGKPYYRLDGGIAMCHFTIAALEAGWRPGQSAESTPRARSPHAQKAHWRIPRRAEVAQLRFRYRIPAEYDILGVFE
jgi:nitroreductase